ncbi:type II toxin-antitoxin system VapC family toxin [Geoalkalibacter halelectricus]|uniref:Type II toxin-antitoxin system VapC family toxin n=1 Tax=Geoalkalibacter halelectricus TaxID=2847045 RepID=A0ABY5ZN91_9BACT|nr:type II toxin-antitoxin system VapC family toxin [Geoalkalibacter halelectricus]MDO3378578.1 type II toxin-antitoxin system VapC family toxin [Geoalkalibacter halelectricus]UWZ80108.1 type II toxin-antitoxin system VapC family toxin [Geoalkalibacter halelectricus]
MIAVDTNIVVRLLTGDDPSQMAQAREIFTGAEIFIAETVMLETEWVLRYAYDIPPATIHDGLLKLFGLPNVVVRDARAISQAFEGYRSGMDFADSLHLATCGHCEEFFTFDKKFVRSATGSFPCKVRHP